MLCLVTLNQLLMKEIMSVQFDMQTGHVGFCFFHFTYLPHQHVSYFANHSFISTILSLVLSYTTLSLMRNRQWPKKEIDTLFHCHLKFNNLCLF